MLLVHGEADGLLILILRLSLTLVDGARQRRLKRKRCRLRFKRAIAHGRKLRHALLLLQFADGAAQHPQQRRVRCLLGKVRGRDLNRQFVIIVSVLTESSPDSRRDRECERVRAPRKTQ